MERVSKINANKPEWLKVKLPTGEPYHKMKKLLADYDLHTVCESAACPNRGECWSRDTATVMILGNICTRSCGFCNVLTGKPTELDLDEPRRVAQAVALMDLKYVVITSVNRDELADGGASVWASTISEIKQRCPQTKVEVLIPDFQGKWDALEVVLNARPNVLNHNIETVPRLYRTVRPQAVYERSLELLARAKKSFTSENCTEGQEELVTKSGIMVGLGESESEVIAVLKDLKAANVDLITIGQYMQPTEKHLPVAEWITPVSFVKYREIGMSLGFRNVFSGPLVRSSYHAEEQSSLALAM